MARTNCVVTDNGSYFDRDTKLVYAYDGCRIADLYSFDIGEMSDPDLIIMTVAFEEAYKQGQRIAQERFATKIRKLFEI